MPTRASDCLDAHSCTDGPGLLSCSSKPIDRVVDIHPTGPLMPHHTTPPHRPTHLIAPMNSPRRPAQRGRLQLHRPLQQLELAIQHQEQGHFVEHLCR